MTDEAKVVRDLRTAGAKYMDSAKTDIMNALRVYKELRSDVEHNFQYPDMKRRNAFKLIGTIPITYRSNNYRIPVSIYLWETHPYYAPLCFVNPTPTMKIVESESVNKTGRIFLPYLNEWRFPGYDLYGLIQMMVMVFQERCPVFSSSPAAKPSMTPPAIPTPYPLTNPAPYPVTSALSSCPYPSSSVGGNPPYPTAFGSGYNLPHPQPSREAPPIPPPPSDPIKDSLITAIEAKLKERLRDKLGTTYAEIASMRKTQQELRNGQQQLRKAVESLEKSKTELDSFNGLYQEKKAELERALRECGESGANGEKSPSAAIDEVIDVPSALHRQLLQNYAADLACDDLYYVLGQALKKGNLSVMDYLKHIREVSRLQFVHRITMRKCRITLGLPE